MSLASLCVLFACTISRAVDGDLDPTFGAGGMALFHAVKARGGPALTAQPDGRLIACDSVQTEQGANDVLLERFNADGSLDNAFGLGGSTILDFDGNYIDDICAALAVQRDGRIVVAGARVGSDFPGGDTLSFEVARVDMNGALDLSFANGAGYLFFRFGDSEGSSSANSVALDAAGRIVVAGSAQPDGTDLDIAVARLLPDGTFDTTFNGSGRETIGFPPETLSYDYASGLAIDAEGRIVLAGVVNGPVVLLRLANDGSIDPTFGEGGSTIVDAGTPNAFLVDRRGRFVVAGQIDTVGGGPEPDVDMVVARFRADGSVDAEFGAGGIVTIRFDEGGGDTDRAFSIAEQPDGRLVVLGPIEYGDQGLIRPAAARVLADGVLDLTFGQGGKALYDFPIATPANEWFFRSTVSGGRVVVTASVRDPSNSNWSVDDLIVRLDNDAMLVDGFDP